MKAEPSEGPKNEGTKLDNDLAGDLRANRNSGARQLRSLPRTGKGTEEAVKLRQAARVGRKRSLLRELGKKAMYEELMEQIVSQENATAALMAVKRNRGAAGIDRMTVRQLEEHIHAHGEKMTAKLLAGKYVPSPVRRVEIPKPTGGVRMLGIPTVQDRWIQQMVLQVLQPIYDPTFSENALMVADTGLRGLPLVCLETLTGSQRLTIEFVRRTSGSGSGLTYIPEFSSDLQTWEAVGTESVSTINPRWDRVKVVDSLTTGDTQRRFARLRVELAP